MTELSKLRTKRHRIKSNLAIIRYCDEGKYPYALCYKDVRKRRIREIELRHELKKVQQEINEIQAVGGWRVRCTIGGNRWNNTL